jgi:hypothetical protein
VANAPAHALPPGQYSIAQAALRVWTIRHLHRERAIDPRAADLVLRCLRNYPNPRVAALAELTTREITQ